MLEGAANTQHTSDTSVLHTAQLLYCVDTFTTDNAVHSSQTDRYRPQGGEGGRMC